MNERVTAPGGGQPPRIPGYRLEQVLGRGATGVVYRAVQLSIGRVVALKVLHPGSLRDSHVVRRLQREARTAARLAHPNIVSAIDMGRTGETWWFAMELVEGDSLSERLAKAGPLSERRALAIFIPLCDALQHAEEKGVVHRDIKPANILLEHGDVPRLVDLGLARVENDPMLTRTGATLGTPHYVSPEQAREPSLADARSDIWSLGATMFHATCGRPPFTGASAAELISNVLYGSVPDPRALRPELSKGFALVLRKCLSREPERRYGSALELRRDLERVRARKAPAIRRSALDPVAGARGRRAPLWSAAALAAAGLATLFLWRPWSAPAAPPERPAPAAGAWPRFDTLVAELAAGTVLLSEAWVEREALCADPVPGYTSACRELWQELYARLENDFDAVTRRAPERVGALLGERRFEAARALLDEGLATELRERTGFEPATLPTRFAGRWQLLIEQQRERVAREREGALDSAAKALVGHFEHELVARVAKLRAEGRLAEALALVERRPQDLAEDARADLRGLAPDALAERLRALDGALREASFAIAQEQKALDNELARFVEEEAGALEDALREGREHAVSEAFERAFGRRLAESRLSLESLRAQAESGALAWRALARFDARRAELVERERELLAADAEARFLALEDEAQALYARRAYEEAAALWRERAGEPRLAPLARMAQLRAEEAERLAGFLARAAAGVKALQGETIELPVASIKRLGRVVAEREPLAGGFRFDYEGGGEARFRLRPSAPGEPRGEVLDARAVEFLARAAPEPTPALELALFRLHEGDLPGAREALEGAEPEDDDLLTYDLRQRLVRGMDRLASLRERERAFARGSFERLTSRRVEGDREKAIAEIELLLRDHAAVFSEPELARLRELKASLSGAGPSTEAEFRQVFAPTEVELVGLDEVRLYYRFDESVVGTWEPGEWSCDGAGWIRGAPVASDAELVRCSAPRLLLVDPFVVGPHLEVRVVFEQPSDSRQNLLVLSAFGFHAVFTRAAGEPRARFLVDTAELDAVIEAARAGAGSPVPPFEPGSRHELLLGVSPDRGQPFLWIDGDRHELPLRRRAGNKRSQSVSIRSIEPLRLLEAEVRGGRR